jgi:hypothetical protein
MVTTGFPGSTYFSTIVLVVIRLDNLPMTWMVKGSFLHLPGFLMQRSQIFLVYMGMYFIYYRRCILTRTFFSYETKSNSGDIVDFSIAIHSRK